MIYIKQGNKKHILEQNSFPDGTPLLKMDLSFLEEDKRCFSAIEVVWCYDNMSELFLIKCLVDKIYSISRSKFINLFLPYVPNARQDRIKNPEDFFTLKSFITSICDIGFDRVTVVDPHSEALKEIIDVHGTFGFTVENPIIYDSSIIKRIQKDTSFTHIHFPDEGALSKYQPHLPNDFSFSYAEKIREWETGKITGLNVLGDSVKGKKVLMVDDICSYGGTFFHNAKKLKEDGAEEICLWVTHCENSILKGELCLFLGEEKDSLIKTVYTTDSILTEKIARVKPLINYR